MPSVARLGIRGAAKSAYGSEEIRPACFASKAPENALFSLPRRAVPPLDRKPVRVGNTFYLGWPT